MTDLRASTHAYFDVWNRKDAAGIRALLHPDVRFVGPLTQMQGRENVAASFASLLPMLQEVALRHVLTDGERAIATYDFICNDPIGRIRIAEALTFSDGLIMSIELFFDPRPFLAIPRE